MNATSRSVSHVRPHWGGPGTRVPPIPLFVCAFAAGLWLDWHFPWPVQSSGVIQILALIGSVLAAAGLVLFAAGMWTFARAKTGILLQRSATQVVTSGPYRWSRNPMYVSFVALYIGGALLANTFWPLIFLPLVLLILTKFVIAREEEYLHRTFADRYADYARRVPRWI